MKQIETPNPNALAGHGSKIVPSCPAWPDDPLGNDLSLHVF
jgi:hypothetical protein